MIVLRFLYLACSGFEEPDTSKSHPMAQKTTKYCWIEFCSESVADRQNCVKHLRYGGHCEISRILWVEMDFFGISYKGHTLPTSSSSPTNPRTPLNTTPCLRRLKPLPKISPKNTKGTTTFAVFNRGPTLGLDFNFSSLTQAPLPNPKPLHGPASTRTSGSEAPPLVITSANRLLRIDV